MFPVCEQVHLSEREKQKLQVWSRIMPYKQSFAWAIVPLFDNSVGATSGGPASPSSPLAPSVSGSSSHDGVFEPVANFTLDGKLGYSSGSSVVVEISNLNKVKESYTEDSLQVQFALIYIWLFFNIFMSFFYLQIIKEYCICHFENYSLFSINLFSLAHFIYLLLVIIFGFLYVPPFTVFTHS